MVLEYHIENDSTLVISLQLLLLFQKIFSCIFCYGTYTWPHGVMNKVSNFGSGVVTVFFQRATLKQRKTDGVVEYESWAELTASLYLCSNPI